ncbi:MAG: AI-2E family transporter [Clostridiales Family XIII bacterium]|jgi:predicted PurR-regulated permease PerM|nr:AI-2E family transporter [Clostridiales Family XIII bacterium]
MQQDTKKIVKIIFIILIFVAAILFVYFERSAFGILIAAVFLSIIIDRPVNFLEKHLPKGGRKIATLIVVLLILGLFTLAIFTVIPFFVNQLISFTKTLPEKFATLESHFSFISDFIDKFNIEEQYNQLIKDAIDFSKRIALSLGSSSITVISSIVDGVLNLIFIIVLTFSFISSGKKNFEKAMDRIYINKEREKRHLDLAKKLADVIADFFVGQITVATIAAIVMCLVTFILSLIFHFTSSIALPASLIIFVTSFIPMFGAIVGVTVITLLILLYNPLAALIFLIFHICYQQVEGNFISPKVQAKRLNMTPALVLISIIFGLKLFGAIGAIIAIPIGGCLMVLFKELMNYRKNRLEIHEK